MAKTEFSSDADIYNELLRIMRQYHPSSDFSQIEKAYLLAKDAHGDQIRKSGAPYIVHPLSVAVILAELELDRETIVAGILHDVIEDTKYSYNDISAIFGEEIAELVDGVTKLDKLQYSSLEEKQAENYRKMFFAMAKDIRVIIIKICDRLHNLRTLKFMEPEKQVRTAQETMDIYAPLANRLGISKVRYELEDLSFRYINPDAYYDLKNKIQLKQSERDAFVQSIVRELKEHLDGAAIEAYVDGRPKHFFSIYRKMVSQGKDLDQIYDLFAVRAIVDSIRNCYEVLGIVHELFKPMPGRLKDYIVMPKPNFYQSLHNTMLDHTGEPFEVQIRTWEMHRTAEYGIAAHWKYKESKDGVIDENSVDEKLSWLRQMLDLQKEYSDNKEYLDILKLDLNAFKDSVYCFSPKGSVISLVSGSTPIDFAYAIHSAVGNKMIGAKVNNKIVNNDYELQTGDRVEILTSQNSKGPSRDWLQIVKTSQAKSKINQWFKKEDKEENAIRGKELLEKGAKKKGYALSEILTSDRIKIIQNKFSMVDWESVCAAVGHGGIKEGQVINRLIDEFEAEHEKSMTDEDALRIINENVANNADASKIRKTKRSGIVIKGIGDVNVRFSKCCGPVPGDEVIGFVTRGRGVSIHRTDCINIITLDEINKHRLIDAEWHLPEKNGVLFRADIRISCDDRFSLLVDVSRVISDEKIEVKSLNARTQKTEAIFDIGINITSKEQLEHLTQRLLAVRGVREIERITT